ncbi:MAG: DMT family transporter [Gemmatimonadetes bacterium]|nr:DMT family transporter [Gemmatimonadota bacterium]
MHPLVAVHLAVLLFGAAGLFGKLVLLPPTLLVLGRVVFAAGALGVFLQWRERTGRAAEPGGTDPAPPAARRWSLVGLGILLAIHWVTFFHAIQLSTVAIGLLTFATFPIFTALLEPLLPGERFEAGTLAAAAVSLAGIAWVVPTPDWNDPYTQGAFWGVVSGATFALLSLANRLWVRDTAAARLAFHQDLWAAVVLLPFLVTATRWPTPSEWLALAFLGVVLTAGAHALFIHGLSGVRAGRAAVIASLEPVYGVVLAVLVLGERPEARTLVGGAVVLAAAAWVSRPARANG